MNRSEYLLLSVTVCAWLEGAASTLAQAPFDETPEQVPLPLLATPHKFGSALAVADLDGDGKDDLVVADPSATVLEHPHAGAIFVYYSQSRWSAPQVIDEFALGGVPGDYDHFGYALAAGDLNGDGRADLAVGVPDKDIGAAVDAGAVHVLYSAANSGLTVRASPAWSQDCAGVIDVAEARDHFGRSLAIAPVGQSSVADLVIGVPGEDITAIGVDTGAVQVLFGSATGVGAAQNQLLTLPLAGAGLGHAVGAADHVIWAGAPYATVSGLARAGLVVSYRGGSELAVAPLGSQYRLSNFSSSYVPHANDAFGASVAVAAGLTVVGAPGRNVGTAAAAGAVGFYSAAVKTVLTAAHFGLNTQPNALFGAAVAARNVPDGDSGVEVAVAAPRHDQDAGIDAGAVGMVTFASNALSAKTSRSYGRLADAHLLRGAALALAADPSSGASRVILGAPRRVNAARSLSLSSIDAEPNDPQVAPDFSLDGPARTFPAGYEYLWVNAIEPEGDLVFDVQNAESLGMFTDHLPLFARKNLAADLAIQAFKLGQPARMEEFFGVVERALNVHHVDVRPWLLLNDADGIFPNAINAATFIAAGTNLVQQWKARGLPPTTFVVDMEPPSELTDVLTKDPLSVKPGQYINHARFAEATAQYTAFVKSLKDQGWKVMLSVQGSLIADYVDGDDDIRQLMNTVIDGPAWDEVKFQLYRSAFSQLAGAKNLTSFFVYDFLRSAQKRVPNAPSFTLGAELGTTYKGLVFSQVAGLANGDELLADVEAAQAAGLDATALGVFSLMGIARASDPESWLQSTQPDPAAPANDCGLLYMANTCSVWAAFEALDAYLTFWQGN